MHAPRTRHVGPELLLIFALLPGDVPLRALCQALGREEQHVINALYPLEHRGLAQHETAVDRWRTPKHARSRLMAMALRQRPREEGELGAGLRLLLGGRPLEGGELVFQSAMLLLQEGHSAGALLCLDILLHSLKGWSAAERPATESAGYLDMAHKGIGLALYMTKRLREAEEVLCAAVAVARSTGDKAMELRLRLLHITHQYLAGGPGADDPHRAMDAVLADVRDLGDTDVRDCSDYGTSLQHYARGEFAAAIARLLNHADAPEDPQRKFFSGLSLLIIANAACSLGRFDIAIGRMVGHLHQLRLIGDVYSLRRIRMQAADILLRAGFSEEALEMMSDTFACCDIPAETHLAVWGCRTLALYHYRRGNTAAAHHLWRQGTALACGHGLYRPYFGFSETFDLLQAFMVHGLPDIPGLPAHYSLDFLLRYALNSGNPQWQGIAMRIRALELLHKGGCRERAIVWLKDGLSRLQAADNPLEAARTELALAEVLEADGRGEEAVPLRVRAHGVLVENRQYEALAPETAGASAIGAPPVSPVSPVSSGETTGAPACLERCSEAFAALPPWHSFGNHMQRLIDAVRDAMRVERAALFDTGNGRKFLPLAVRHFSREELDSSEFLVHHRHMAACRAQDRPRIERSSAGVWLYLPLTVPEGGDCLLILHCAFLTAPITDQTAECFDSLRRLLETELRLSFRLRRNSEARRLAAAGPLGPSAPSQWTAPDPDQDGLYYGPSMQTVLLMADRTANTDAPVLVLGETGVGKEELARRVHAKSGREGPFVAVQPASIPETLFESELFGHEKGAFTGAHRQKMGLLELADQGTLFIDEIGDIPMPLQVKLLRVLQSRRFMRVGGIREVQSDFRLISATNQDLERKMREGGFREDLYYRVAVVPLHIPPLRRRQEDIGNLALMFYERFKEQYQRPAPEPSAEELDALCQLSWPGNVRELKSFMERAVILHDGSSNRLLDGLALAPRDLPHKESMAGEERKAPSETDARAYSPLFEDLPTLQELQRRYIRHVLALTGGRVDGEKGAMAVLGMKRSTLYAKIREYGLDKASQLYGRDATGQEVAARPERRIAPGDSADGRGRTLM